MNENQAALEELKEKGSPSANCTDVTLNARYQKVHACHPFVSNFFPFPMPCYAMKPCLAIHLPNPEVLDLRSQ